MNFNVAIIFMVACFAAATAGCTNVVDAGTVVTTPQTFDASSDPVRLTPEELCTRTGGTVETRMCCGGTGDFPRMCWDQSCSCNVGTPNVTMGMARLCICPRNKCFMPISDGVMSTLDKGCNAQVMGTPPPDAGSAETSSGLVGADAARAGRE
ncbi:MAG TPA: hypothetical protein VFH73_26460 [Polyangia bacterium]|jgi:hypothetical protein|nr:hypothetical protein [Polyangia bacterium]